MTSTLPGQAVLEHGLFRGVPVPTGETLLIDDLLELGYDQPWSDGMPMAPLDLTLVDDAIATVDHLGDDVIGTFPDGQQVTVRDAAVATILAGGIPAYLPVVVAATEAFFTDVERRIDDRGSDSQCVIVNGPIAQTLDVNGYFGAFGPGWRANAAIGRALRLIVTAGAGFGPSAFGDSAQYTLCFSEELGDSGWTPLSVTEGFGPSANTVTVHSVRKAGRLMDRTSHTPEQHVERWAMFLRDDVGAAHWEEDELRLVLVVSHEWRRQLVNFGWSKEDFGAALYPLLIAPASPNGQPLRLAPEDLTIISTGGPAEATGWTLVGYGARPATNAIRTKPAG